MADHDDIIEDPNHEGVMIITSPFANASTGDRKKPEKPQELPQDGSYVIGGVHHPDSLCFK